MSRNRKLLFCTRCNISYSTWRTVHTVCRIHTLHTTSKISFEGVKEGRKQDLVLIKQIHQRICCIKTRWMQTYFCIHCLAVSILHYSGIGTSPVYFHICVRSSQLASSYIHQYLQMCVENANIHCKVKIVVDIGDPWPDII